MEIGQKIRSIRKEKNISPKQISDRLGISLNAYHKKETGHSLINIKELEIISKELGVLPQNILSDEGKYCNINSTFNDQASGFIINNLSEQIIHAQDELLQAQKRENQTLQELNLLLREKIAAIENK